MDPHASRFVGSVTVLFTQSEDFNIIAIGQDLRFHFKVNNLKDNWGERCLLWMKQKAAHQRNETRDMKEVPDSNIASL